MATQMTITEGLAEIKTIGKRIPKKRANITSYLWRPNEQRDPLGSSGGSAQFIKEEQQGLLSLENRIIKLRAAIQRANVENSITVHGVTRTIADWLTWRREVAPGRQTFLAAIRQGIANMRDVANKRGQPVVAATVASDSLKEIVVNIDEKVLAVELETTEQLLGDLDGQLQLRNATLLITIED